MINVTAQELESIMTTIDNAIEMHAAWRERLHRTFVCKLAPNEADLAEDAHQRCAFGKWFYSSANAHLRKLPSFKTIETMHEVMHGQARQLCVMAKGHWPITTEDYDPFIDQMGKFRSELLKLRQKTADTLHKIDALTGAYNSALLLPELKAAQELQKKGGRAYSLLLLRFDLAEVNRNQGRDAGDQVLRAGVNWTRAVLGPEDKIYRYAGAEFVICLPGKTQTEAEAVKESLLAGLGGALGATLADSEAAEQEAAAEEEPIAVDEPAGVSKSEATPAATSAALNVQYGVIPLEPEAYIEHLIQQAALATYTITI